MKLLLSPIAYRNSVTSREIDLDPLFEPNTLIPVFDRSSFGIISVPDGFLDFS
jgi:hypothetical protein